MEDCWNKSLYSLNIELLVASKALFNDDIGEVLLIMKPQFIAFWSLQIKGLNYNKNSTLEKSSAHNLKTLEN